MRAPRGIRRSQDGLRPHLLEERRMSIGTVLLIVLVLLLVGALPAWSYSARWGYAPSRLLSAVFLLFLVLLLMGRI
jgi:hypothetical protein